MKDNPQGYGSNILKMPSNNSETFRFVFEQAPIGMFVTNFKGRFTQVNNTMSELIQYPVNKLLQMSFQDIVHPDDINKDLSSVRELIDGSKQRFILEKRCIRSNGDVIYAVLHGALMRDARQRPRSFIGQIIDVTERKGFEQAMLHLAYHDQLTGLPNRTLFREKFFLALTQARIGRGMLAVVFIDIDRFKTINDTLGHIMGDQALKIIADRLTRAVRSTDLVARLGGDEFAIILPSLSGKRDVNIILDKIIRILEEPLTLKNMEFVVTASMGVALHPADGQDMDSLLQVADTAMYESKNRKGISLNN